ncbi:hypothetical protein L2K70_05545 [Nocardioides KLBMP 9356]|uniref:Heparan-alpha-glucosaminide N-acetyltransferase catalytic domain-containing protein n=1 Tax=Nocardioides potassii TaxID=2911371 RepID=A0ABS9HAC7_9ACTN|nr:heparan-alpha-glucosaminide N-acetyltransferase domain-containing protein [Nocardioides potassii]MCF6377058.1 hypothetical protein [Nocardioides potassii]
MTHRRPDVDLVRFVALVSMYVAHVTPIQGPAHVFELSEYLTMPLFALLVGVGAELGAHRRGARHWYAVVVRALALVALGLALERAGAQVVVVLAHLGVVLVLAALLARLPTVVVGAVALVAVVVGPWAVRHTRVGGLLDPGLLGDATRFAVGGPYRLLPMLAYAAIGIVLARLLVRGPGRDAVLAPTAVGAGLLLSGAAMLAAEQKGIVDLVPYSGTLQETTLDALVATGVALVGLAAARALARGATGRLVSWPAAVGAMTLTLYALQVLWLAYDVRVLHPGAADDSWRNLAVLLVGSLAVTAAWHAVVRRGPWRRGPLEGLLDLASRGPTMRS